MRIDPREKENTTSRQESRDKRPIASCLSSSCQSRGVRDLSKFDESKYPASRTFAISFSLFVKYSHRDFNSFSNDKIFFHPPLSFSFFLFFSFNLSTKTRMLSSVYSFNASIILHVKRRSLSFFRLASTLQLYD